jgi:hypothetical protein
VIKRISLLVTAALMAAMMMVATAAPAFAAARQCSAGDPGCKTRTTTQTVQVDDPTKNNPKFFSTDLVTTTETQRGNFNQGTTGTNKKDTSSQQISCQNPSGGERGPTCK